RGGTSSDGSHGRIRGNAISPGAARRSARPKDSTVVTLEVLVVDDEPGMRLGVVRALHDYTVGVDHVNGEVGFSVRSAESGEEALDLIQAAPPHILIVDHKLPGMTGLELLER